MLVSTTVFPTTVEILPFKMSKYPTALQENIVLGLIHCSSGMAMDSQGCKDGCKVTIKRGKYAKMTCTSDSCKGEIDLGKSSYASRRNGSDAPFRQGYHIQWLVPQVR